MENTIILIGKYTSPDRDTYMLYRENGSVYQTIRAFEPCTISDTQFMAKFESKNKKCLYLVLERGNPGSCVYEKIVLGHNVHWMLSRGITGITFQKYDCLYDGLRIQLEKLRYNPFSVEYVENIQDRHFLVSDLCGDNRDCRIGFQLITDGQLKDCGHIYQGARSVQVNGGTYAIYVTVVCKMSGERFYQVAYLAYNQKAEHAKIFKALEDFISH